MNNNEQKDRRIQRTRKAIMDAFFSLVVNSRYDDISIKDIIEKANLGRSTFYKHYKNKDEVLIASLDWPLQLIANTLSKKANHDELIALLRHFWQKRSYARLVFSGAPSIKITLALKYKMAEQLTSTYGIKLNAIALSPDLTATLLANAYIALLLDWLTTHSECSVENIAQAFTLIADHLLHFNGSN